MQGLQIPAKASSEKDAESEDPDYRVYFKVLPRDSRLPVTCRTEQTPACHVRQPTIHRTEFNSELVQPNTREEGQAWYRWAVGHHYLFDHWLLMAECCRNVAYFVQKNKPNAAALWMRRAGILMVSSTGAMMYSGAFEATHYQKFLRKTMNDARPGFSAGSSIEYYELMAAADEMGRALREVYGAKGPIPTELASAHRAYHEARTRWFAHHFQVAGRLQPGDSLLEEEIRKWEKEHGQAIRKAEFIKANVKSPEARADYDRYFGVVRQDKMYAEDFHSSVRRTVGDVRADLPARGLDAQFVGWMEDGNKVMLEITGETLDPSFRNLSI